MTDVKQGPTLIQRMNDAIDKKKSWIIGPAMLSGFFLVQAMIGASETKGGPSPVLDVKCRGGSHQVECYVGVPEHLRDRGYQVPQSFVYESYNPEADIGNEVECVLTTPGKAVCDGQPANSVGYTD
ncbi:hypothetical protein ACFLZX_06190 [Nanoarchaeota archaeon]